MASNHPKAVKLAAALCLKFEGLYLKPYICPAGVPTIGVGCTEYPDGRKVRMTDPPITRDVAMVMLYERLTREDLRNVLRCIPNVDTHGRAAALASFNFNLGSSALRGSTLRRKAQAGEWDIVKTEFMRWTKAGGKVLRGLVTRRAAEAALI